MLCTLFGVGVGIAVAIGISVAVLKTAINLTNQFAGGRPVRDCDYEITGSSWAPRLRTRAGLTIHDPNTPHAVVLVVVAGLATTFAQLGIAFAAAGFDPAVFTSNGGRQVKTLMAGPVVMPVGFAVGFFVTAAVLSAGLSTTFVKGCAVALFEMLIWCALGLLVYAALAAVGAAPVPGVG